MKKIDDKKIKGISIELDRSIKLNELDDTINDFKKNTDDKHEIILTSVQEECMSQRLEFTFRQRKQVRGLAVTPNHLFLLTRHQLIRQHRE